VDIDRANADHLLTTTRAVRRRLDLGRPVPLELVRECLEVALQAPTGGNVQRWRWLVVTDPKRRAEIANWYRAGWESYVQSTSTRVPYEPTDPRFKQHEPSVRSAQHLVDHFAEVPMLVVPCVAADFSSMPFAWTVTTIASVVPAVWSFMLAARARGLGTCMTTLSLWHEREVAHILGLPDDVTHLAMIPVAYFTGDSFSPVERLPLRDVAYHDHWGQELR
jgi:nitroreductase